MNQYPKNLYFTGFIAFFLVFHLLGQIGSVFSDVVLLVALYIMMKDRQS
ncbi:hypothetical protein BY447_0060 [Pantoea sp. JKS000250]|uniref:Uncharacterized protein n=1 Tax=Candidatus Pantoea floridensis TaxID=1938870 RepID=A0A286BZY2_9GAMM|nr:hypothetical protein BX596_1618 [Enterobacteriaceae bacterium JKS000233]PXW18507.1 hypothetical protein BY447_0060 [Pantoea sp. JKS000250]SOD39716.1 hypothetical protein SAMN06273570_4170 [Pantoea floridensis]